MPSPARNRTLSLAAAVTLLLGLALPGAGLAGDSSAAGASGGSSAGAGVDDGSVFCDPATLPDGAVCSLTPNKEEDEPDPAAQGPAPETSAERLPLSAAAGIDEGENGGDETPGDAFSTEAGDVGSVALARTGLRAWLSAVLGGCLLLTGASLLAASRRRGIDR